ncbi:hypothetical protein OSC52_14375 [Clostridium pasteurianum]|nr:hypothetical protein [Clostridium pasteurianum]UZW16362.1 hypothetical protein OSC52_14375 [Clostridium pasteurianum]
MDLRVTMFERKKIIVSLFDGTDILFGFSSIWSEEDPNFFS